MGITEKFASFIVETNFEDIPQEVVVRAKEATLDCLGVILAAVDEPIGKIIIKYVREKGCVSEAGVIGGGFSTSAEMAALANGTLSHALDYDDYGAPVGHPSMCIVPTVLSLGQKLKSSGKEMLEAMIIGYEIQGKIGLHSVYLPERRGLHSAAVYGTMGAAAAAARLLKLDTNQVRTSLGIAGSQVAGLLKNGGTMTKPLHAGNISQAGITAAILAKEGFTANSDIIETPRGYGDTFFGEGNYDEEKMAENMGNPFYIVSPGLSVKKYPCCGLTHRSLDAISQIIEENDIKNEQVAAIIVGVPEDMFPLRADANTGFEGKWCIPYTTAAVLVDGKVGLNTFTDEMVQRPVIRDTMSKVQLQVRNDVPIYSGSTEPGRAGNPVTVRLNDGRVYENQIDTPRGTPQAPLTLEELSGKYRDCAEKILSRGQIENSIELVLSLEKVKDIGELMRAVTERQGI
ncbi:MmgE/PrpD family protein [Chloroflexota bacterium]